MMKQTDILKDSDCLFNQFCTKIITFPIKSLEVLEEELLMMFLNVTKTSCLHPLMVTFDADAVKFFELLSTLYNSVHAEQYVTVASWQLLVFLQYLRSDATRDATRRESAESLVNIALHIGVGDAFMADLVCGILRILADADKVQEDELCKFIIKTTYMIATRDDCATRVPFAFSSLPVQTVRGHDDNGSRAFYGPVQYMDRREVCKIMASEKSKKIASDALMQTIEGCCLGWRSEPAETAIRGFNTLFWLCRDFYGHLDTFPMLCRCAMDRAREMHRADMMYSIWLWIPDRSVLSSVYILSRAPNTDALRSSRNRKIEMYLKDKSFGANTVAAIMANHLSAMKMKEIEFIPTLLSHMITLLRNPVVHAGGTERWQPRILRVLDDVLSALDHLPHRRQNEPCSRRTLNECVEAIVLVVYSLSYSLSYSSSYSSSHSFPCSVQNSSEASSGADVDDEIIRILSSHVRLMSTGLLEYEWRDKWNNWVKTLSPDVVDEVQALGDVHPVSNAFFQAICMMIEYPMFPLSDSTVEKVTGNKESSFDAYEKCISLQSKRLKRVVGGFCGDAWPVLLVARVFLQDAIGGDQVSKVSRMNALWWYLIIGEILIEKIDPSLLKRLDIKVLSGSMGNLIKAIANAKGVQ